MKTLKESLLADIEDTLAHGDEWEKNFKGEIKEFLKAISMAKNYESIFNNGRKAAFFVPNLFKQLGYDANHINIMICTMYNSNSVNKNNPVDWKLNIWLTKHSDDNMEYINSVYDNTVYMDYCEYNKWNDVVRELIKPATKSLDTFKKFLDNMEKWNEQLVSKQLLLK